MTGERIAHYEVIEQLGRGGMGVVYRDLWKDADPDLRLVREVGTEVARLGK